MVRAVACEARGLGYNPSSIHMLSLSSSKRWHEKMASQFNFVLCQASMHSGRNELTLAELPGTTTGSNTLSLCQKIGKQF